tara:strand:+ start:48 stop:251 length:204 start_codon:yes stop_codon:yes gene_type:complete
MEPLYRRIAARDLRKEIIAEVDTGVVAKELDGNPKHIAVRPKNCLPATTQSKHAISSPSHKMSLLLH